MTFSGVVQFILGVVVGVTILGMSGLAAGSYFFNRLSVNPDRPVFPEEQPVSEVTADTDVAPEKTEPPASSDPKPNPDAQEKPLEPGAYRVRVTWPDGLSLREEPNLEANRLGSVLYDQEMIVLKTTEDGLWDRVRIPGTDQEGWVKAGNDERIDEED